MNPSHNFCYSWWQLGLLKLAVACVAVSAGAYWSGFFLPLIPYLLVLAVAFGIYLSYITFARSSAA